MSPISFATIGTSFITEVFLRSVQCSNCASRLHYHTAYSRSIENAKAFAKKHGAQHAVDDLYVLANNPEIGAVYIASPNALHFEQAKLMLAHKKHVLLEKPFVLHAKEANELFEIARKHNVVILEAMRTVHDTAFAVLLKELTKRIGKIETARFDFSKVSSKLKSFRANESIPPVFNPRLGGSACGDLGIYVIEAMVALWGKPACVTGTGVCELVFDPHTNEVLGVVDMSGVALCSYSTHQITLSWSKVVDGVSGCEICGYKNSLFVPYISEPNIIYVKHPMDLDIQNEFDLSANQVFYHALQDDEYNPFNCAGYYEFQAPFSGNLCGEIEDFVAYIAQCEGCTSGISPRISLKQAHEITYASIEIFEGLKESIKTDAHVQ